MGIRRVVLFDQHSILHMKNQTYSVKSFINHSCIINNMTFSIKIHLHHESAADIPYYPKCTTTIHFDRRDQISQNGLM